jgi:hypothetical protein
VYRHEFETIHTNRKLVLVANPSLQVYPGTIGMIGKFTSGRVRVKLIPEVVRDY